MIDMPNEEDGSTKPISEKWWQQPEHTIQVFILLFVATYTVLTYCLLLTRRDSEQRDSRAYVYLDLSSFEFLKDPPRYGVALSIINGGKTWARNVVVRSKPISITQPEDKWSSVDWSKLASDPIVLGPGQSLKLQLPPILFSEREAIARREAGYEYLAWITYDDAFDAPRRTQMAQIVNSGEGVISFSFIGTHNCADNDCPSN